MLSTPPCLCGSNLRFVDWQILLHSFEVSLVGQEGLKEGFTLNHCVAVRATTPKEFELKFFLVKCDTIFGGVGEDEFLFPESGGEVVLGGEEKQSCRRQRHKTVAWAEFVPGSSFDVVYYRRAILGDLNRQGSMDLSGERIWL